MTNAQVLLNRLTLAGNDLLNAIERGNREDKALWRVNGGRVSGKEAVGAFRAALRLFEMEAK